MLLRLLRGLDPQPLPKMLLEKEYATGLTVIIL
jgi:hypothetical protein